jgi:CheY-like chemotaxis protein
MKQSILVVEDNLANRELLFDSLEAKDFQALAAENMEQAFAAFSIGPRHHCSPDGLAVNGCNTCRRTEK